MAASRRSPPADGGPRRSPVDEAVGRALETLPRDARACVGFSGGRDSVALLAAASAIARERIVAVHVHHGLSPHADAWASFCSSVAASLNVRIVVRHVTIARGDVRGIEAAARSERHDALREAAVEHGAQAILVAHHQDDQAETVLLQLARGSGPAGLAGMARERRDARGIVWLRPLLDLPRRVVEAYVAERGLRYVDDDSNASHAYRRNALRSTVIPAFAATFPGYPATIARAAAHQAEATRLADDLAAIDAAETLRDGALDRSRFSRMPAHRARNLLRHFLRLHGLRAPSTARLAAMAEQLAQARADARIEVRHDGAVIGVFRDRIVVHRGAVAPFEFRWHGEPALVLAHGCLRFTPDTGSGLARERLDGGDVVVRSRAGGERLQPFGDRPRRALKAWLQDARMPPWERAGLPLVFCDGELAVAPGIGVDVRFEALPGRPSIRVSWDPRR